MGDFDKEAERRRLREKYEKDESRRQETARMSELLLKGATMTNVHCDDCGAPIFRYQGREFCPNCQAGSSGGSEAVEEVADEAGADGEDDATVAGTVTDADAGADGADAGSRTEEAGDRDADDAPASPEPRASAESRRGNGREPVDADRFAEPASASVDAGARGATAADARASLLAAVTAHAARGESADDPRRAREHLAAAREAAEALSALDR
jgi:uncharacterized Zn finger protein (UPF0148 family)